MTEEKKVEPVSAAWNLYYQAPEDGPCLYEINVPLTMDMFKQQPKDILKTKLSEFIGDKFVNKRGLTERDREETYLTEEISIDYFEPVKFVALFFSIGNAAPCKIMLRFLRNYYSDINLEQRQFEVLVVPMDKTKAEFEESYRTLCWPTIPFGDGRIKKLSKLYQVTGVPQLVILDARTGFMVTKTGRKDL